MLYTNCRSEINNTQVDDARNIDVKILMYNLIECGDTYSKASGKPWHYRRYEPDLGATDNIIDFPADNNNRISLKFQQKTTEQTESDGKKDIEIKVPLKCLSNFGETLKCH